jgi:hypothetical protein
VQPQEAEALTVHCTQAAAALQQQLLLLTMQQQQQQVCHRQEAFYSVAAAAAEAGRRLPRCQQAGSLQALLLLLLPLVWICTSWTLQQQLLRDQSKVLLLAVHRHLH